MARRHLPTILALCAAVLSSTGPDALASKPTSEQRAAGPVVVSSGETELGRFERARWRTFIDGTTAVLLEEGEVDGEMRSWVQDFDPGESEPRSLCFQGLDPTHPAEGLSLKGCKPTVSEPVPESLRYRALEIHCD
jgi:hypothetical protein